MALQFMHKKETTFKDGCTSLRKSVMEKMRDPQTPGPIYNPTPRVSSVEKSLRNITFGTGPARYNDNPSDTKRRVPKGCHHPGPQTYDPEAIRKAIYMSKQRNVAGIKFGSSKRDNSIDQHNPSPAEYDPEMIRRGVKFSKPHVGTYVKFGTARNNISKPCPRPGPATYNPEAIRRGLMFTKCTLPSVKFGDPPKKDSASQKKRTKEVPSPQEYDTENIRRGLSSLSTKRRPIGVKFRTGPRTQSKIEEKERVSKPGPSSYNIPSALGNQVNSRYRSQPSLSFGAR